MTMDVFGLRRRVVGAGLTGSASGQAVLLWSVDERPVGRRPTQRRVVQIQPAQVVQYSGGTPTRAAGRLAGGWAELRVLSI
jgi:hypothetical protein